MREVLPKGHLKGATALQVTAVGRQGQQQSEGTLVELFPSPREGGEITKLRKRKL